MDTNNLFSNYDTSKFSTPVSHAPRNERESLIQEAVAEINKCRIKSGYTKLTTFMAIKMQIAHLSTTELSWFINHCKMGNFSWEWREGLKEEKDPQ